VSFHARFSSYEHELEGVEEAFACAQQRAPVHVLHVTSTGATWHPREAAAIAARAHDLGLALFFDFYPYTSWSSGIQRARFQGDWLARYRVGWNRVRIAGVAGPVDADRLERLRRTGSDASVIVDSIPQETLDFFALETDAPIGSDTTPASRGSHPRGAGSFTRFMRTYVASGRLPLGTALHRFSTAACERFAPFIPALARRGRVEVGYDADLVLWDPRAIRDHATLDQPLAPSSGVHAALVNGVPVIVEGRYVAPSRDTGRWMQGRLAAPAP
jgi:dihydroorotase